MAMEGMHPLLLGSNEIAWQHLHRRTCPLQPLSLKALKPRSLNQKRAVGGKGLEMPGVLSPETRDESPALKQVPSLPSLHSIFTAQAAKGCSAVLKRFFRIQEALEIQRTSIPCFSNRLLSALSSDSCYPSS